VRQKVNGINGNELSVDVEHKPVVGVDIRFDRVSNLGLDDSRLSATLSHDNNR
jgi:hypothetical protein